MHIIFGKTKAEELSDKYTVLELDTFILGENGPLEPAYCIIENVPITDLPKVESMRELHKHLIHNYGQQDWKFCLDAISYLKGFWNGEIDSFYADLSDRILEYQQHNPGLNWSPAIQK